LAQELGWEMQLSWAIACTDLLLKWLKPIEDLGGELPCEVRQLVTSLRNDGFQASQFVQFY